MKHSLILDPQGRKRGGDTPLVCAPLVGNTRERLLREVSAILAKAPDLVEWRVDHFDAVADTAAVLDALAALRAEVGALPIIFTCRAESAGGRETGLDEARVVTLHEAVCASGQVQYVDFELDGAPALVARLRAAMHASGVRLILSYHNLGYTPGLDYLVERFLEAERLGADVAMVQVQPRDRGDVLRLLAATAEADAKARIPLISMSIGPLGSVSRLVGGLFGSALSFAVGDKASVPGQFPIGDLVQVLDIIGRARGDEMF